MQVSGGVQGVVPEPVRRSSRPPRGQTGGVLAAGEMSTPATDARSDDYYASFSHFFRKLFLAAPFSGLPLLSTALGSHASFLHFWTSGIAPLCLAASAPIRLTSSRAWQIVFMGSKHIGDSCLVQLNDPRL
jgi:hypothetical protein